MRKDRRRKPTPEHAKARLTCLHLPSEHLSKPLSFFSCQKYIHEECLIWVVYVFPPRRSDKPAPAVGLLFIPTIFPAQTFPREWLLFVVSGMGFLSSTSPANTRSRRVSVNYFVGSSRGWRYTLPSASPGWVAFMRHSQIFLWLLLQVVHNGFASFTLWVL